MPSLFYTRTNLVVEQTPGLSELADSDTNKKVIANGLRENIPGMTTPIEANSIQDEIMTSSSSELPNTDATKKVIADAMREKIPGMTTPIEDGSIQDELTDEINENEVKIDNLQTDIDVVTDKLPEGDIADEENLAQILNNMAQIKFTKP